MQLLRVFSGLFMHSFFYFLLETSHPLCVAVSSPQARSKLTNGFSVLSLHLVRLQPLIFWEGILVQQSSQPSIDGQSRCPEFSPTKHIQFLKAWAATYGAIYGQIFQCESVSSPHNKVAEAQKDPSSETQGQLVGTIRYFRASDILGAKVCFKG